MGNIFSGDKIYFDELSQGISTGLFHDNGLNWDAEGNSLVTINTDVTFQQEYYNALEILDLDITFVIDEDENYSKYVDLLKLVPEKFRSSVALQEFLEEAGLQTGSWLAYIDDLAVLIDKYNVSETYIQYLADLVGLKLLNTSTTNLADKRRQLVQVIDWYKMKGTYAAMLYIAYILNITLLLWDRYTNDYATFIPSAWFVGDQEGETPTTVPVRLLAHFEGENNAKTYRADTGQVASFFGDAHLTTSTYKFGSSALDFSGNGYITFPYLASPNDWYFGTKDFIIDLQVKFNDLSYAQALVSQYRDASNHWAVYKDSTANGNVLGIYFIHEGVVKADYKMTSAWFGASTTDFFHLQFARNGAAAAIWINGISQPVTSYTSFGSNDVGNLEVPLTVGLGFGNYYLDGTVDELRVTKATSGISNFTAPTIPYVTYYKAPYIGLEIVLNQVYGEDPDKHLLDLTKFDDLSLYVEQVRPVNVVPKYSVLLLPTCDETGTVTEVLGEIKTCTIGTWEYTKNYFDQKILADVVNNSGDSIYAGTLTESGTFASSGDLAVQAWVPELYFDDGLHFDVSRDSFLASIVKWRLGTGNKGVSPDTPGFIIQNELLAGTISKLTIYSDRSEIEFEIPSGTSYTGISELALYLADDTLMVASTFPDIDLAAAVSLRIVVTIYR